MKSKLVISLLAILVIVLGFFAYLMASQNLTSPKTFEREITKVETTSDSDDIDTIEADLNETDVEKLDAEISEIDAELK